MSFFSDQWSVVSGQTDTEAIYLEVVGRGLAPAVRHRKFEYDFSAVFVGEGLAPPEENEMGINGCPRY